MWITLEGTLWNYCLFKPSLALFFSFIWIGTSVGNEFDHFEKHIRPILIDRCYSCHSAESENLKGSFFLDTKQGLLEGGISGEPAIVPGDAKSSLLIYALSHTDEALKMPPEEKLSDQEIQNFVEWIDSGAPDPRDAASEAAMSGVEGEERATFWSFQTPTHPPLPTVHDEGWPTTEVDRFILSKLEANGLQPSPPADKRTLIRRVTYDLIGLPPTPEEVETFQCDDSPEAYEKLVDRLLASPHYGERWGRHWLDVARYADTKGYVYEGREEARFVHSFVYRDWVIRAFNKDMPYNRFLKLQIAADQMVDATNHDDLAAMGFLTLGRRFLGVAHDIIDDRIDTVTRGMMGLTVSCARCHDHKFDPIPTEDYYSLYGVFAGSSERLVPLDEKSTGDDAKKEFWEGHEARVAKLQETFEAKREELAARLRDQVPEYLIALLDVENLPIELFYEIRQADELNPTVVRQWQAAIFRAGKEDPVFGPWNHLSGLSEDKVPEYSTTLISLPAIPETEPPSSPAFNKIVARALFEAKPTTMREVAEVYGELFKGINDEWNQVIDSASKEGVAPPQGFEDPEKEQLRQVLYRPESPARAPNGAIVDVEWFFDEPTRIELSKLQLAIDQGIFQSPAQPRFAVTLEDKPTQKNPRVLLRGNPANKGKEVPRRFLALLSGEDRAPFQMGSGRLEMAEAIASPENPLTARVMVNRVWAHHFGQGLVSTPSDFGTRSAPPSHPELLDWLATRFIEDGWSAKNLHRSIILSSAYRQSSDRQFAGAAIDDSSALRVDPENRLYWKFNRSRLDFESLYDSVLFVSGEMDDSIGGMSERPNDLADSRRRTLYRYIDRVRLPGLQRVFDFPNPDMHSPSRYETTVPQQALHLMNSPFLQGRARSLAARVEATGELFIPEKVDALYRLTYQRGPTENEVALAEEFIENCVHETLPEPPPPNVADWSYGYGRFATEENRVADFTPIPHYTGSAFQGGPNWPDDQLGWVQLTATGGHPGNDLAHAVIRRWTAPSTGTLVIEGTIHHQVEAGDGIRARIVSSRSGPLGEFLLHNQNVEFRFEKINVQGGDTIDLVVDIYRVLNSDQYDSRIEIEFSQNESGDLNRVWDSEKDFSDQPEPPPIPMTPWEKYAQALLCSNEFAFVD